jgi:hypothetical protein
MGRGLYIFLWRRKWGSSVRYRFFVHKKIISAVRRVQLISKRVSFVIIKGRWCNITVLNARAPCEDKGDDVKDSFCDEIRSVFYQFRRYDMKILLGDFNTKVGRGDIYKLTVANQS